MINISGVDLTVDETAVLSKGLSFCPTNNVDPFKLKVDTFKFFRSLQLKHFFSHRHSALNNGDVILTNSSTEQTQLPMREITTFKKKSTFVPHSNLNPSIITYSNLVEKDLSLICKKALHDNKNKKLNLSNAELKCLNELEQKKDIVIRSADKGGSIVVMSFDQYNKSILSQLTDNNCYTPLSRNPAEEYKTEINMILEAGLSRGWITKQEKEFLSVLHPICPIFYGLPKIH